MKGSYLENKKMPKEGDIVYFLQGFNQKVMKGKIVNVTNIDKKGLANTYVDVESGGKNYHNNIHQIYDHKPKKVIKTDDYGEVKIWEERDILDKIDLLVDEGKKKFTIKIDTDALSQKKAIRIPIPPTGGTMKDKSKYNRKKKYKDNMSESKIPTKWDGTPKLENCNHCGQPTRGNGGSAKIKGSWINLCDDCLEEVEMKK
jgi:hypothetical protein